MNELQGAVAGAQMRKVKWVVEQRRKVAKSLTEKLEKIEGVKPPTVPEGCKHSYWLYPLRINLSMFKASLEEIAQALKAEGIPATAGYIGKPLYTALIFQGENRIRRHRMPLDVSSLRKRDRLQRRALSAD